VQREASCWLPIGPVVRVPRGWPRCSPTGTRKVAALPTGPLRANVRARRRALHTGKLRRLAAGLFEHLKRRPRQVTILAQDQTRLLEHKRTAAGAHVPRPRAPERRARSFTCGGAGSFTCAAAWSRRSRRYLEKRRFVEVGAPVLEPRYGRLQRFRSGAGRFATSSLFLRSGSGYGAQPEP
jgi:hypothetical protein